MNLVDDILSKHASSESKLTVRTFTTDDKEFPQQYVLFEGDANALRFLAEFILAHVNSDVACDWSLHPSGAGSVHFSSASTAGIFLHKLPCDLHPENTVR